jgi:hypothetical protein
MTPQSIGPYQAGDAVAFEIDIAAADGSVADLTGITAHFRMARPRTPDVLVVSTEATPPTATAVIENPPTGGVVKVQIAGTVTDSLLGTYEWHCDLRDGQNANELIARGYVTFTRKLG